MIKGYKILLMLLIIVFSASSASGYELYLRDNELLDMTNGNFASTVTLEVDKDAWWYTKDSYDNFTLPNKTWKVEYFASTNSADDETVTTYLYHINQTKNELKYGTEQINAGEGIKKIVENLNISKISEINLQKGDKIALRIKWSGSAEQGDNLTVYFNSSEYESEVTPPIGTPVFPIPEMSTLALTSAGLVGLFSVVRLRRRRLKC